MPVAMRCVWVCALLGTVSAHWPGLEGDVAKGKGKGKGKGKEFGEEFLEAFGWHHDDEEQDEQSHLFGYHHGDHGKGKGKGKGKEEFVEAHVCHWNCGEDTDCHEKCPKPWDKYVAACQLLPKVKACYENFSESNDFLEKCPSFEVEWIQEKFVQNPKRVIEKGEHMCPELEKRHACHQACSVGDFDCHKKCHSEHGWHHDHEEIEGTAQHGWHHHGEHGWHRHFHDGDLPWHHHGPFHWNVGHLEKAKASMKKAGSVLHDAWSVFKKRVEMAGAKDVQGKTQPEGGAAVVV